MGAGAPVVAVARAATVAVGGRLGVGAWAAFGGLKGCERNHVSVSGDDCGYGAGQIEYK